jgi:hypothetical protein
MKFPKKFSAIMFAFLMAVSLPFIMTFFITE